MKKITACLLAAAFITLLPGCATVFKGPNEHVSLNSDPRGAEVYINDAYMGDTPLRIKLEARHGYRIEFRKEGYKPKVVTISNHIGAGWVVLDVITGLVPVLIDAVTGSWYGLDQTHVNAALVRQQPRP
jgi:hypothetical protein